MKQGFIYIVMELIERITLRNTFPKGKFSIKEATSIAIQVSMGLSSSHGIVHRDVKPQRCHPFQQMEKLKETDFESRKELRPQTQQAPMAMVCKHHSSPEQVRGGYSADGEKSYIYSGITPY